MTICSICGILCAIKWGFGCMNKKLFILDFIGTLLGLVVVSLLMIVLSQASLYFLIIFGLLFIYTIFVLVDFIRSIVQYMRQSKIKKYSSSIVSIMKYKYLVW